MLGCAPGRDCQVSIFGVDDALIGRAKAEDGPVEAPDGGREEILSLTPQASSSPTTSPSSSKISSYWIFIRLSSDCLLRVTWVTWRRSGWMGSCE